MTKLGTVALTTVVSMGIRRLGILLALATFWQKILVDWVVTMVRKQKLFHHL